MSVWEVILCIWAYATVSILFEWIKTKRKGNR